MEETHSNHTAEDGSLFTLGNILGQKKAFGLIAGRCSAAEAAAIRRLREEDLYRPTGLAWKEFCPRHLGMSRAQADRIIHHLEEFGAEFFELTQLMRIPPEAYRTIASQISDGHIHYDGKAIALLPENSERVAEAVTALRALSERQGAVRRPSTRRNSLDGLCDATTKMLQKWSDLVIKRNRLDERDRERLVEFVANLRTEFEELERGLRWT